MEVVNSGSYIFCFLVFVNFTINAAIEVKI